MYLINVYLRLKFRMNTVSGSGGNVAKSSRYRRFWIGILVILAKIGLIFRHEVLKIAKKPEDMLKRIVLAFQKSKQI